MANTSPIKTTRTRGANMIAARPTTLRSTDGTRTANGRYVKRSLGDRRFDAVYVYTLRERVNGRLVTVSAHRDADAAKRWIESGDKSY